MPTFPNHGKWAFLVYYTVPKRCPYYKKNEPELLHSNSGSNQNLNYEKIYVLRFSYCEYATYFSIEQIISAQFFVFNIILVFQ